MRVETYRAGDAIKCTVDGELCTELATEVNAVYDLAKIRSATIRNTLSRALQRGYITSTSGKAFKVYGLLAETFDFPIFAIGRGGYIMLGMRRDDPARYAVIPEWSDKLTAMNRLAGHSQNGWYGDSPVIRDGPTPHWVELTGYRPNGLDIDGLLHLIGVNTIWEIVPRERTSAALSLLLQGGKLKIRMEVK